jgi:hypothetical protein
MAGLGAASGVFAIHDTIEVSNTQVRASAGEMRYTLLLRLVCRERCWPAAAAAQDVTSSAATIRYRVETI